MIESRNFETLRARFADGSAVAGVIGMGYVGLPLAAAIAAKAYRTIGFDIDPDKVARLNRGESYIGSVASEKLAPLVEKGRFSASADTARLRDCDVIVICVPTPLTHDHEPDLSYVIATARDIARALRPSQLVVLESTSYPGTTKEVLKPILEEGGLVAGRDFFLGFSPEREDPGNERFETVTIPKIVAGADEQALALTQLFYSRVVDQVVPVSSLDVAEAVKITENVFRAVNIALVNELKVIFDAMGIDIWEVIEGAKTKPFGYMPFYPGPGLGGHCIPIDPFYLTWKARQFGQACRFIELAGQINVAMPDHVVAVLAAALKDRQGKTLAGAKVLILGLAYKKNIPDLRESPSFALMELLVEAGVQIDYHDPHIAAVPPTREHSRFTGMRSVGLTAEALAAADAILISTDHDDVDYELVARQGKLILDTRNIMARLGLFGASVVKA
jgi:UDP-N-acetyl-D-glucosamine dehydrogenase